MKYAVKIDQAKWRQRIYDLVIYMVFAGVVFASFRLPEFLLESRQFEFAALICQKDMGTDGLSVEAKEIYLVRAIHDMEAGKADAVLECYSNDVVWFVTEHSQVTARVRDSRVMELEKELLKLQEAGILQDFVSADENAEAGYNITVQNYRLEEKEYTMERVFYWVRGGGRYTFNQEQKSGKILSVAVADSVSAAGQGSLEKILADRNIRALLEGYIGYLGLDILGDWVYEGNRLHSQKAQLTAGFEFVGDTCFMSIHSGSGMFEY